MLLHCMSPFVALRDILQRHAISVALGAKADIEGQAEPAGLVAIDP
jgi:hypothetical protein